MRKKIAAGNWKMYKDKSGAYNLAKEISSKEVPSDVEVILGVPFVYLDLALEATKDNTKVYISAQNCHQKNEGAYTGEISPYMLKSMNVPYVILGHSERREYNNETPELLKEKVIAAFANELKVIFCIGESLEIRKQGNQNEYVTNQLKESLSGFSKEDFENIVLAYEPIWAIGTGETASPEQAQDMHQAIRDFLKKEFGEVVSENTPILYGGSVKPANAKEIFGQPDVDGGLVGGASLDSESFYQIIKSF
ncbi:MAG: triose-phosphate isomerase [Saprospiraceae bacterium]